MTHDHVRPPLAPTPRRRGPRRDHLDPRNGRFLDPSTAVRSEGQQLSPTPYAGDQLLVRPTSDAASDAEVAEVLRAAAAREGCTGEPDEVDARLVELARRAGVPLDAHQPLVVRFALTRRPGDALQSLPDAWRVLQRFRREMRGDPRTGAVQLEHLLTTAAPGGIAPAPYIALAARPNPYIALATRPNPYIALGTQPNPYIALGTAPNPYIALSGEATAQYAQPGWGGRMPVAWVGPRPPRRTDEQLQGRRRPVVAVLDTGTGVHPWLDDAVVDREPRCADLRIGLTDPGTDLERTGVVTGRLTGSLDIEAGHGTFVAGLVHQRCPDARILSVRVVQPDGVVSEYDLLQALNMLWLRQELALREDRLEDLVDVVSVSLGYYHEEPSDALVDPLMLAPLRALGRLGVCVVTSAGNDATDRPMYPAAFAPWEGGPVARASADEVPVVAVGALNPDGTVALFSNGGPWVRALRPGAGLVSTMPTSFDGGAGASVRVEGTGRGTIDPDNFSSGFATWSGTSFAAPILAGDLAACLNEDGSLTPAGGGAGGAVRRTWQALRRVVPGLEPA